MEAILFAKQGYTIILVGHEGHDEVIGTMGEAPDKIVLVDTPQDVEKLKLDDPDKVAVITQTTLSLDDTKETIQAIKKKFPRESKRIPKIGEKYVRIIDKNSDYEEIYYNCEVVDPKDMTDYYDDLSVEERKSLVFAMKYKRLEYDNSVISENDYQYFGQDEFSYLKLES